jgi:gliding motility-associated-like protein
MKTVVLIFTAILLSFSSKSSHIVGGDIYYDYLGNNQYKIYISVFRDCLSNGADFDSPLPLGIFASNSNLLVLSVDVPYSGKNNVPVTFNNPCVIPPSNICTENSVYTTTVTLPPMVGGYKVAYVRCCRGPNINNIVNPEDIGLTLTVNIPGVENGAYQNSSPRFVGYPPMLLCNNDALNFDHSATEPDGDQLVYSLATPFRGGTSANPMPSPTPSPPYIPIPWTSGYSQNQPLGPGSTIAINPSTGVLTASPNLTGRYVVGIRVDEYRNGVLISSMIRDFIFRVFNCNITLEAILPLETELPSYTGYCTGNLNVQFSNNSYGGTNYFWNFGDPATTTDVSTAFEPSYTYSDTGKYFAMLVVNPGWPCTDTAYMEINLYNALNSTITHTDSICLQNNVFDFQATTDGPVGTQFTWDFGLQATPASGTGATASTHFNTEGVHQVILTSNYSYCQAKDTAYAYVIPQPVANFSMPSNYECDGLEITFINNTQNAQNHFWDFGIPGATSTQASPTFTFPEGGTYTVNYYTSSSPECMDSMQVTIHVNEKLEVSFTQSPNQCITDNLFDFIGTVSGPDGAVYKYTFGPGASVSSVTDTNALGITYGTTGNHIVTLTGQFENCVETFSSQVFIYAEPTIGFGLEDGMQCAPYLAKFINYSTADSDMAFEWDFGDGSTSNEANPSHVYENPGQYPVTLSVTTSEGCIDTLFLTQVDLIDVNPTPVAAFSVDKTVTDICHSVIQFTNLSQGAVRYYYHFDDHYNYSEQESPAHTFYNSGDHYVYMIATSEEGCSDTAHLKIYIEPFTVFIPNSFTPNDDGMNDVFVSESYLEPKEWEFKIYNRWGEKIYETNDYQFKWDGKYKGELVPFGLYNYTLRYRPCSEEDHTILKNGHINVIR